VVVASFEDWPSPASLFDAVVSASAFHWIDPAIRVTKAAQVLRTGGSLAIIETRHQPSGGDDLFAGLRRCYERWSPTTQPRFRPFAAADVPESSHEIEQSSSFDAVAARTYDWEQTYTTIEYLDLLMTYSDVLALEPPTRSGLLACIGRLIDDALGGEIRERYRNHLLVARTGTHTSARRSPDRR
jgi:SAM-dependent methyltransferase